MTITKGIHQYIKIMPDSFVSQYTAFPTFQAMLFASSIEDVEDLASTHWNSFVAAHSLFSSWREMHRQAAREWPSRKLKEEIML